MSIFSRVDAALVRFRSIFRFPEHLNATNQELEKVKARIEQVGFEVRQDDQAYMLMFREELNNALAMLRQEDRNLAFDTSTRLQQEMDNRIEAVGLHVMETVLQTRLLLARKDFARIAAAEGVPAPTEDRSFEAYLEQYRQLHPHLYETWARANLEATVEVYRSQPEISVSIQDRQNARLFAGFIAPYLNGRVLDVGCGPVPVPYYLQGYPTDLIAGIDPLLPFDAPHPFTFVQGFAEFLPWEDDTFDVLIAATSLDHVLSLELALKEMRRVLKPGGLLLTWDWYDENAAPYDPAQKSPELIDQYHLFNFNEAWFEEIMTRHFSIEEKIRLYGEYQHDRFYALRLKPQDG